MGYDLRTDPDGIIHLDVRYPISRKEAVELLEGVYGQVEPGWLGRVCMDVSYIGVVPTELAMVFANTVHRLGRGKPLAVAVLGADQRIKRLAEFIIRPLRSTIRVGFFRRPEEAKAWLVQQADDATVKQRDPPQVPG